MTRLICFFLGHDTILVFHSIATTVRCARCSKILYRRYI